MLYVDCVAEFKRYLSSYAAADTIEYYNINLEFFTSFLAKRFLYLDFDIRKITRDDFIDYIAACRAKDISDTSAATYSRAIKRFLKYCYTEGHLFDDITRNVKLPKNDQRMIMPLTGSQIAKLETHFYKSLLFDRNCAMMYLMLDCGLRRSEVVRLNREDIDLINGYIVIQKSKNRKSRIVPMTNFVDKHIHGYLHLCCCKGALSESYYRTNGEVLDPGPLFLDANFEKRVTNNSVELVFQKAKAATGIKVYPHLFRHTFATSFVLGGGNLEILRILMGHSSYNVTQQYLHLAHQYSFTQQKIYKLDDVMFKVYNYNM